jgi:hypothetical protein
MFYFLLLQGVGIFYQIVFQVMLVLEQKELVIPAGQQEQMPY